MSWVLQPPPPPHPPFYTCIVAVNSVTSLNLDSLNALVRCKAFLRMLGGDPEKVNDVIECLEEIAEICKKLVYGQLEQVQQNL